MARIGRPPTCVCGECAKCKHAAYMREWYSRKSLEERREYISKRDPERVRANDVARYYRNPAPRLALARKWRLNNPEKAQRASDAWAERNPDKVRAQTAVGNAVRDGRLARTPCEVCGNPKVDGHHEDYSKPLDVRWLCRKHHMELHRKYEVAA